MGERQLVGEGGEGVHEEGDGGVVWDTHQVHVRVLVWGRHRVQVLVPEDDEGEGVGTGEDGRKGVPLGAPFPLRDQGKAEAGPLEQAQSETGHGTHQGGQVLQDAL